uniref:Uncharacterized protein n=1 Tax=Anguilla anguilla TaxID=7936 RepID=A0A0E9UY56_ANGAN
MINIFLERISITAVAYSWQTCTSRYENSLYSMITAIS